MPRRSQKKENTVAIRKTAKKAASQASDKSKTMKLLTKHLEPHEKKLFKSLDDGIDLAVMIKLLLLDMVRLDEAYAKDLVESGNYHMRKEKYYEQLRRLSESRAKLGADVLTELKIDIGGLEENELKFDEDGNLE